MSLDPTLRQFLAEWLSWVDAGAPEHDRFNRRHGLCHFASGGVVYKLRDELVSDGLDYVYPFNPIFGTYSQDAIDGLHHRNGARIAWVRKKLAEPSQIKRRLCYGL